MRHIKQPFTIGKHDRLTTELNEMSIAIKLHHIDCAEKREKPEEWAKAQASCPTPTWERVLELIDKARREMDSCRVSPIKY